MVKRRLSAKDRDYQKIVNKLNLSNQDNIASKANRSQQELPQGSLPGKLATRRNESNSNILNSSGELLDPNLGNNIFEIITIPFPHFFVAEYEITFWTQYITHMNQMLEKLMTSYHAQGNQFKITSPKGYWFVAFFDDNVISGDNFSDYSEEERIVRYTLNIKVPGYMIAPANPGDMNPFRRYLSAPQINFQIEEGAGCEVPINEQVENPAGSGDIDKFILNEVQELDKSGKPKLDQRLKTRFVKNFVRNPFTNESETKFVQVLSRNKRSGETVANTQLIKTIEEIVV